VARTETAYQESGIGLSGLAFVVPESSKDLYRFLPVVASETQEIAVPRPGVSHQFGKGGNETSPQWIQVDIPDQLEEVRVILTDDRFEAVGE
jgi:hypothetical protein